MDWFARIRFVFCALMLAGGYYYVLNPVIGWTAAQMWPGWWIALFPTRHIAVVTWTVAMHTSAVFAAAVPIAIVSLLIDRRRALWLGAIAGVIATVLALEPSLAPAIWPLIWNSHPVFFVTDQIKLVAAVPLLVLAIGKVSSNFRWSGRAVRLR